MWFSGVFINKVVKQEGLRLQVVRKDKASVGMDQTEGWLLFPTLGRTNVVSTKSAPWLSHLSERDFQAYREQRYFLPHTPPTVKWLSQKSI